MKTNMRKIAFITLILALLLILPMTTALAKGGGKTTQEILPITAFGYSTCTENHFDVFSYSGNLNIVSHVKDVNGKYQYVYHINGQGLEGMSWFGDTKYQVVYINQTHENIDFDGLPAVTDFSIMLYFVSKGQGGHSNFLVEMDFHSTINANGKVTTEFVNMNFVCK